MPSEAAVSLICPRYEPSPAMAVGWPPTGTRRTVLRTRRVRARLGARAGELVHELLVAPLDVSRVVDLGPPVRAEASQYQRRARAYVGRANRCPGSLLDST